MNIRTAIAIVLIIFALGLCFWLFIRPLLVAEKSIVMSQELDKDKLFERRDGSLVYLDIREEVKEWGKMLASFAPMLSVLVAYLVKCRRKSSRRV